MVFKKISSVLSIILTLALIVHICIAMALILGITPEYYMSRTCALIVFGIASVHVLFSIITFFACKGIDDIKKPSKTRVQSILSLIFAIVILLLLTLHINDYIHAFNNNIVLLCIIELVFIFAVLAHSALSIGKAFKNLGIVKTDKGLKTFTIWSCIIAGIIAIAIFIIVIAFMMGYVMNVHY